ncbi:MAG: Inner membrane protein YrbG [Verrucomicrobia subdivision 3 bacterium]|nr:Inner membrane protein YrbG [Limisphaerales bacterium]MCS1417374.1 Inner membrane protein YrbG [Limisphaerales bacterium]
MMLDVVLLAFGIWLIVKGGDLFVSSSVRIAEFLDVPRVVIGTTLVSLATTSSELVVTVVAGIKGESGLAVGNAVGSCMCNVCLVLGVMAVIRSIRVRLVELKIPLMAMFFFAGLLLILTWNLRLSRGVGFTLVVMGIAYFICDFWHHRRASRPEDIAEVRSIEAEVTAGNPWLESRRKTAVVFALGAVMVIGGSLLLVDSATSLAEALGVSSIVIGLTIVAVGTSLPELVTAISSVRKNVSDLGVGNILGANVANLTLIVGGAASFNEVTMSRVIQLLNFPALLIGMSLVLWMLFSDRRISRREGVILIGYYFIYVVLVFGSSAMGR